ncbi:DUF5518 domain-containing protein [Natronobacterium gregoryi]|uniref:DUF5518 domain-containing protein n=2 Tax=Natronobacterium gregoryi TaxID=44930 RepID=L0AFV8_NATGS|nr:DUF5518 domain-containing protein [Natronobacterium gregoryi]AFZ72319.1 hypothetical protein Natgr_1090 [Natronobacterium gregoryi SP2]ELY71740.1 hypothetical protein C490_04627 [Natronobacterium gregoryi SP2]PLK18316.1 hypothetical protein CYV19_18200 [Natronobacterium gregoryi SP2]SFJ72079.1 hypothetical protein SAMN05443661_1657 [Natronobacterium gregoryi]
MRQTVKPSFEYGRGPVLWGAVTVIVLGLVVNFVLQRPGWLMPTALAGGGVAAARSGFYDPSANNGALAAIVGTVALMPVLAITRTTGMFGIEQTGDTIFFSIIFVLAWITILFVVIAPFGYIGGWLVDTVRRRVGGPLGY